MVRFGLIRYGLVRFGVAFSESGKQGWARGTKFSPWLTEHALAWDHCTTQPDGLLFSYNFLVGSMALVVYNDFGLDNNKNQKLFHGLGSWL